MVCIDIVRRDSDPSPTPQSLLPKRDIAMKQVPRDSLYNLMKRSRQTAGTKTGSRCGTTLNRTQDHDADIAGQQAGLVLANRCLSSTFKHQDSMRNLGSKADTKQGNDRHTRRQISSGQRKRRQKYGTLIHVDSLVLARRPVVVDALPRVSDDRQP